MLFLHLTTEKLLFPCFWVGVQANRVGAKLHIALIHTEKEKIMSGRTGDSMGIMTGPSQATQHLIFGAFFFKILPVPCGTFSPFCDVFVTPEKLQIS